MKFNHFSIVEKTFDEQLIELDHLGFTWSVFWEEKKILKNFLMVAPVDSESIQATPTASFQEFLTSDEALTWNIFWTVSLQLLGFVPNFEFQVDQAEAFAKSVNLPMIDEEALHSENLINLGGDAGTSIGNSGNSGSGHCNLIGQLCIFKSKKAGHDLHRASREKHFICILGIEHRIGGILHHYSCL